MSQRNPMNERYQNDEHRGASRKSAASAKPKTKAASTVRVKPVEKTKQQKKAEQKAQKKVEREKQAELDRKYYYPPTAEYKRLRRLWLILLVGAIVMVVLSWFGRSTLPEAVTFVIMGLAYVCIIGALYVDFSKIRKVRRAYQEQMESAKSKEQRALEKQKKAEAREQKAEAEEKYEAAKAAAAEPKKRGLFGSGFRAPKKEASATDGASSDTSSDEAANSENVTLDRAKASAKAASNKVKGSKDSKE